MITRPDCQVEAVLDLRQWAEPMAKGPDGLVELWSRLEPTLLGRDLVPGRTHSWQAEHGTISLEILRLAPGQGPVTAETRFGLAAIREQADLVYRCATCAKQGRTGYASFRCRWCADAGQPERCCVEHAVILDGALTPSCPSHHPACRECRRPAAFWCGGESCRAKVAFCAQHRRSHPHDNDVDYCAGCYQLAFPVCRQPSCTAVGTVFCDWLDSSGKPCKLAACTKHARRWQVFGAEKLGLGLCGRHSAVRGLPPEELLMQICSAAASRRLRMPSLAAFGFNLRNSGHRELAVDYRSIRAKLAALRPRSSGKRYGEALTRALTKAATDWDRELERLGGHAATGEQLTDRLRRLVRETDPGFGDRIAAGLRLAEYKPERSGGRSATLWVHLPEDLQGAFIGRGGARIKDYQQRLGVVIRLEGNTRGGRR
ncbi:hypothetical protein [Nonomuraea cavernae]|uniref:K Homology domain-containing protein n=1 Tax=Nonomuraea cavernae TaxID=2045107 RepID=A0A918DIB9_9ACTN|nr:hypothetical protein [Nonomuraea cavernae]MCA2185256.1 hypothetical protein [Nonomuraea cavernae]GGO65898.1 hypothetical protein GCM10012289_18690 [Nonomuraea cavernae]